MYDQAVGNMSCPARRKFHMNLELNSWERKIYKY
jgi:hypothetical protein